MSNFRDALNSTKKQNLPAVKVFSSFEEAVADYKLSTIVGEGSFGTVYKARHKDTKAKVAIKVVQNIFLCDQQSRAILREIQILRQLRAMGGYQHTVQLLDCNLFECEKKNTCIVFVMNYLSKDMQTILDQSEQFLITQEHVIKFLYSLLCALNFIHTAGLMHRDLKPANILLEKECKIKLCDFGLSRTLPKGAVNLKGTKDEIARKLLKDRDARQKRKRQLSPHVVTRFYRSPEVILLDREYTHKVDLWSAGGTIIELLNCSLNTLDKSMRQPFKGDGCFPLSPNEQNTPGQMDQLQVILNIMGQLHDRDKVFLTFDKQFSYLKKMERNEERIQFRLEYPQSDYRLCEIMEDLLSFNPHFRSEAGDLLKSSLFDPIRKAEMEEPAPCKVHLSVDAADQFDYDELKGQLVTKDYLQFILDEVAHVKKINNAQ